jgi:hypothetical protein
MYINDLILEVTRKCNLLCEHCMRGNAQKKTFNRFDDLETFFIANKVEGVGTITFSGGEPTLAYKAIAKTLEFMKKLNIEVDSIYTVVNGTNCPDGFLKTMLDWFMYCTSNEMSSISISSGMFYDVQMGRSDEVIKKLSLLKYSKVRSDLTPQDLIAEGRAARFLEDSGLIDEARTVRPEDNIDSDGIYINVNGDIVFGANFSYKNQNKYKVGNIQNYILKEEET